MGDPQTKRRKRSRRCQIEPLISRRREDGLWQSIERDEEDLASHVGRRDVVDAERQPPMPKEQDVSDQDMIHQVHQYHRDSETMPGKAHTPDAPSAQDLNPVRKATPRGDHSSTSSRADVLAWVSVSPPQHPFLPLPPSPVPDIPRDEQPSQDQPPTAPRRRRGRPKKSRNAPNWNRPRRVRFSDPIPPDPSSLPESRDTHVFVRLLKIIVTANETHPPQRQELVWNNRAKGWRLAGERSERNIGDISELFDDLDRRGTMIRVLLAPTVQRGAREAAELLWNPARCCFQGVSQDVGSLAVALGEMKDMVKNPWARQFVGYVLI